MAGENNNMSVFIAYGSNLVSGPVTASQAFGEVVKNLHKRGLFVNKISRLWSSKAWPDPNDPPYVNAVLQVHVYFSGFCVQVGRDVYRLTLRIDA